MLRDVLTSEGYEVDTAVDGLNALDSVAKKPYDLLLLDVGMPRTAFSSSATRMRRGIVLS